MLQRRDRGRRRVLAVTYRVGSTQDELAAEDVHSGQQEEPAGPGLPTKTAQHERHGDAERADHRRRRCRQLRRDHDPVLRPGGCISARLKGQSAESSDGSPQRPRLRRYAAAKLLGSTVGVFASSDHRSDTGVEPSYHGSRILSSMDTASAERGSVS